MAGPDQPLLRSPDGFPVEQVCLCGIYLGHVGSNKSLRSIVFRSPQFVPCHSQDVDEVAGFLGVQGDGLPGVVDLPRAETRTVGGTEILVSPIR